MADIKQSAGQNLGERFRITWRSWEPANGATKTPLILLHPLPHSGSFFAAIAPLLAVDRFVFAPDYPGYGASWPLEGPPTISLYAQSVMEAWQAQEISQKPDLFGFHTGCLVAPELALSCPDEVGRLVLVDVPYFSAAECKEKLKEDWAVDGFMAAFSYPAEQLFPAVKKSCLVIATQSALSGPSKAAAAVLPACELVDMPEITAPALEKGASSIAKRTLEFLGSS
jgi:pimeloyl-ACP methyl ester carboxylesterase